MQIFHRTAPNPVLFKGKLYFTFKMISCPSVTGQFCSITHSKFRVGPQMEIPHPVQSPSGHPWGTPTRFCHSCDLHPTRDYGPAHAWASVYTTWALAVFLVPMEPASVDSYQFPSTSNFLTLHPIPPSVVSWFARPHVMWITFLVTRGLRGTLLSSHNFSLLGLVAKAQIYRNLTLLWQEGVTQHSLYFH